MTKYKVDDVYLWTFQKLAKEHKKYCEGEQCNISLALLAMAYEKISGRELTTEEWKEFV